MVRVGVLSTVSVVSVAVMITLRVLPRVGDFVFLSKVDRLPAAVGKVSKPFDDEAVAIRV